MLSIRRYEPSYMISLVRTINRVCNEDRWMQTLSFRPTSEWNQALLGLNKTQYLILVVLLKNNLIGWCRIFVDKNQRHGDLGIGILKEYRDQKIGTRLLCNGLSWAAEQQLASLQLICRDDNFRAIHLFKKVGFVREANLDGNMLSMRKSGDWAYG